MGPLELAKLGDDALLRLTPMGPLLLWIAGAAAGAGGEIGCVAAGAPEGTLPCVQHTEVTASRESKGSRQSGASVLRQSYSQTTPAKSPTATSYDAMPAAMLAAPLLSATDCALCKEHVLSIRCADGDKKLQI